MSDKEKNENKELREKLFYTRKNGYEKLEPGTAAEIQQYCEAYKTYLDRGKTERMAVTHTVALAEKQGFMPYTRGMKLSAGDKIYRINRGRAILLAVIGKKPLSGGANIVASHIDSPRLDIKPNPLYETDDMAFFKTHYYGGMRKYQWVAMPLELHGVVFTREGKQVEVHIGGGPKDPVLTISDLLPHLAKDQSDKKLSEAHAGEDLNILAGSVPYADEGGDRIKLAVLSILNEEYGITEKDFLSAELTAVPAIDARDVGLDRSMVGGYGQDDRVCAYTSLTALFDLREAPEKTSVCMLADKEEIGSEGVSGMQSQFFDTFIEDLCDTQKVPLRVCFENSVCMSADVSNAFDPNFPQVSEKRNNSVINGGINIMKYSGARGKSGTSDAGAETMSKIRRTLEDAGVPWQIGELGKVDQGGGGTVAVYMAKRNIETVDAGVPVLSMHSPFEIAAKFDIYMTYKAYNAFYRMK